MINAQRMRACAFGMLLALAAAIAVAADELAEDHRAWQHGIDVIRVGGRLLLVWGSAGNPPRPNLGGDWPHDVYYAWLNPQIRDAAAIEPTILVSRPEAQEPPSVAINAKGTILMTSEDGNGGINQQAGLWDSSLRVIRKYPFMIRRGGHSGHVAAMGERFLIAYGEDWVERGGFLDRGTGKDIYARIVEDNGTLRREIRIASGHRDGWPLVAGSDRNWLVVWQRYPEMTLHFALIDATGKPQVRRELIGGMPVRYAYNVEFAPQLSSYIVTGSTGDSGFVALVNLKGDLVKIQRGLPPMASESRLVLGSDGAQSIGVYPVRPRGVAVVRLSAGAVELAKLIDHPYAWDYAGTTGVFTGPEQLLFFTLSTKGLQVIPVQLGPR